MIRLGHDVSLLEVAVAVSEALEGAGIAAPLSGGAAMLIYTDNKYLTRDLDFVTSARSSAIRAVLEPLGFIDSGHGRHFEHEPSGWLVECPPGPVSFGDTSLSESDIPIIECEFGKLRVITPTQSLMDRLAAYFHWNRQPELRQQVRQLVTTMEPRGAIEWHMLYEWADREGIARADLEEVLGKRTHSEPGLGWPE